MAFKSLTTIEQLDKGTILELCRAAQSFKQNSFNHKSCEGKIMYSLFFSASTRTRFSTETAWARLGGHVISLESKDTSSISKGETIEHTLAMFAGYQPDVIAIRTQEEGVAQQAEELYPEISWINCGDGSNQHPTQALLDIFSIWEQVQDIGSCSVALVGDVKHSRAIRSLATVLSLFGANIIFVAPESLHDERKYADSGITYHRSNIDELSDVIQEVDFVYSTRPQFERMSAEDKIKYKDGIYQIDTQIMKNSQAKIMSPMPIDSRVLPEIHPELDADPRSIYFQQAQNGLWMRAALLHSLTNRGN